MASGAKRDSRRSERESEMETLSGGASRRAWHREWIRRPWLREGLIVTAFFVVWGAWWIHSARLQGEAVRDIRRLRGVVVYADDLPFQEPFAPILWLERRFGHDYTSTVAQVNLGGKRIEPRDVSCLAALSGLRALWLHDTEIDDDGLSALAGHRRLEELSLRSTRITNAGLASLAKLERLEFLYLNDTAISDSGLAHLQQLTSLKTLDLARTRVTAVGVRKLSQALPETRIIY